MGNMYVRGSSTYESAYHDDSPRTAGLNNIRTALANLTANQGLTQDQYAYMHNRAPRELLELHNSLARETERAQNLATVEQDRLSGVSYVNSGVRPERHVEILNELSSRWESMQDTVQQAMNADLAGDPRGVVVQNPSGSMCWGARA